MFSIVFRLYLKMSLVRWSANNSISSCSNFYNMGSSLITFSRVSPWWECSLFTLALSCWFCCFFFCFFPFADGCLCYAFMLNTASGFLLSLLPFDRVYIDFFCLNIFFFFAGISVFLKIRVKCTWKIMMDMQWNHFNLLDVNSSF